MNLTRNGRILTRFLTNLVKFFKRILQNTYWKITLYVNILSAGSSFLKFKQLIDKYLNESSKMFSTWTFFNLMQSVMPASIEESNFADHFSQLSDFNMTSISQQRPPSIPFPYSNQDPDVNFLLQLVPDIKAFDGKSKSTFKLKTMELIHNLKYNNSDQM